jgi:hypothetical protein
VEDLVGLEVGVEQRYGVLDRSGVGLCKVLGVTEEWAEMLAFHI